MQQALEDVPLLEEMFSLDGTVLGTGGFGVVLGATPLTSDEPVAVKRLTVREEDKEYLSEAMTEATLLKELQHPNVVQLIALCRSNFREQVLSADETHLFLVMEFYHYTLDKLIRSRIGFTNAHQKMIMIQLLTAVDFCHHKGVVHRDIKPANVMVKANGQVVLGDFGLAAKMSTPEYDGTKGTIIYMAPEVIVEQPPCALDPKNDIWSVGCVMYELATRHMLFSRLANPGLAKSFVDLCRYHCYSSWVKFRSTLEEKLDEHFGNIIFNTSHGQVMRAMLAFAPRDRPTADQALDFAYFNESPRPEELGYLLETCKDLIDDGQMDISTDSVPDVAKYFDYSTN